jgi:hypothetical protein
MTSKRQTERLPDLSLEPPPSGGTAPHQRTPGQPGYPQARAMERLRHQHVTRIRKLSRQS